MKKIVIVLLVLLGVNLYANLTNDGLYEYTKGNRQKASQLFKKACDGGDMKGCYNLGFLYANGQGVKQNRQKAKELFGKACDGGDERGCEQYKILDEQGY